VEKYRTDKITLLFSHGNLAVETLSKIVSTIQDSANAVSANIFLSRDKCSECLPSLFTYSCQTICKTRDSFILDLRKTVPSSPVRFLIQKLFWASDEGFKIASCVAPQTGYFHSIQIGSVIKWPFFLFNHLWTVLVYAVLRDTCNARRAPCTLLNLPLCLADCTLR